MPSPFPGMDPYLEAHWRDVHAGLVVYASDAIQGLLPSSLRARANERVLSEMPGDPGPHPVYPDVWVEQHAWRRGVEMTLEIHRAPGEPILVDLAQEPVTETYLEIIDFGQDRLIVTVIEFLSPSNKSPGPNRQQYLSKQQEICSSDANLVEIDLNRFGTHTLAFPLAHLKKQFRTSYMACVRRTTRRDMAEVYPMPLWQRLPVVKVPLRPTDADVPLDLQALVEQCYRNGGYEGTLNYAVEPDPPLRGAERDWADEWLREKGLRRAKKRAGRKGKRQGA